MLHTLIHNVTFACRRFVLPPKTDGQEAQDIITELLERPEPCMIGRFGSAEIQGVVNGILPHPLT